MDGPALDDFIFREIRVNELTTPAAENMAEVESGKSTLTCLGYTPKEVEGTSLLYEASKPPIR